MNYALIIRSKLIYLLPSIVLGGCDCHRSLTISWIVFEFIVQLDK